MFRMYVRMNVRIDVRRDVRIDFKICLIIHGSINMRIDVLDRCLG